MSGFSLLVFVACVAVCGCAPADALPEPDARIGAAPEPSVETLARFPAGTFLENLVARSSDTFLVTSYFDKTIIEIDTSGSHRVFSQLDVHPVGIVRDGNRYVVSAQSIPFTEAPAFQSSNLILVLGDDGTAFTRTPAPEARFLNGLHVLPTGEILVADSMAATLWQVHSERGSLSPWLNAEALSPKPGTQPFLPGANGVKSFGGMLYVSNSSRGVIYRRPLEGHKLLEVFAETGPVDDFAFDADGTLFATTHGASLLSVSPKGEVETLLSSGCGGCTSVVVLADRRLMVINDGDAFAGEPTEASIFTVDLPQ